MTRCSRCNDTTHLEFPDGTTRCDGCDRTPAWCRCLPVKAERTPLWLQRSSERSRGLAKDLTAA